MMSCVRRGTESLNENFFPSSFLFVLRFILPLSCSSLFSLPYLVNMPTTIDLSGKLIILTGGGRGLGIDIAKGLAEAGANLALTYNASPADAFAAELESTYKIKAKAYKMPAEDSAAIDATVKKITEEMGESYGVICNAGICIHQDAEDMTDKEFEDVFKVNTFSPYYLSRAAFKTWYPTKDSPVKDKVILFVSSMSALVYNFPQNQCAYNASKAGLTMLGKGLAGEWAPRGVRVNVLSPGYIATEMSVGAKGAGGWMDTWKERTPLGRFAKPKEIADWLVFMCSEKATFMTGSDVVVDGGYTIY